MMVRAKYLIIIN